MVDEDALERGEKDPTADWTNRMLEKRDKREQIYSVGLRRAESS